jgi:hypothetical protein
MDGTTTTVQGFSVALIRTPLVSEPLTRKPMVVVAKSPKGFLSVLDQDKLHVIAFLFKTQPRKRLGFKSPLGVFMNLIKRTQKAPLGFH